MNNFFKIGIILCSLTVGVSAFSNEVSYCSALFEKESLVGEFDEAVNADLYAKGSDLPTVQISMERSGAFGGKIFQVDRTGKNWLSMYENMIFDAQGDPRYFMGAFGVKAASYFGFKIISPNRIEVPDPVEFQRRIDHLNKGQKIIPISILGEENKDAPIQSYLTQLMDSGTLIFSPEGSHLIHDVSFHTGAIIVPERYINFLKVKLKYIFSFLNFLKTYQDGDDNQDLVKNIRFLIKQYLTQSIDHGFGYQNIALIVNKSPEKGLLKSDIVELMSRKFNDKDAAQFSDADELLSISSERLVFGLDSLILKGMPIDFSDLLMRQASMSLREYTESLVIHGLENVPDGVSSKLKGKISVIMNRFLMEKREFQRQSSILMSSVFPRDETGLNNDIVTRAEEYYDQYDKILNAVKVLGE